MPPAFSAKCCVACSARSSSCGGRVRSTPADECCGASSRGSPAPRPPASAGSTNRPSIPCPSWRACRDRSGFLRLCPTSSVSPCGRMPAAGRSTSNWRRRASASRPGSCCFRTARRPTRATAVCSRTGRLAGPILVCARPLTPSRAAARRGPSARRGARAGAMAVAAVPRDADGKVASVRRAFGAARREPG